jgi:hypothetical protein
MIGADAEKNARLLFDLIRVHKADGLGAISGFFEVSYDWCCPVCHRQKGEIARIDKNGNLFCQLVWHHDHLSHLSDKIPSFRPGLDWMQAKPVDSLRDSFRRFNDILICGDCNVAEGAAKMAAGAASSFSFCPFEMSTFIIVGNNQAHKIDRKKASAIYAAINPAMKEIYGAMLREIPKQEADPETFEQIGGAAWRVLSDARKKMKENEGRDV